MLLVIIRPERVLGYLVHECVLNRDTFVNVMTFIINISVFICYIYTCTYCAHIKCKYCESYY